MFKLLFVYPIIALILVLIASDIELSASVYAFEDNHIAITFPKPDWQINDEPWFEFQWNAETLGESLNDLTDDVVDAASDLKG